MFAYSERARHMLVGAIGSIILFALITLGIKSSFGAFETGYELTGTFSAAGQGLIDSSDVKIRGIDIGEVTGIELVDNQARITMRIDNDVDIPTSAVAVIRPKTLFGEKFVDIITCPDPEDDTNTDTQTFRSCAAEMSGPYFPKDDSAALPVGQAIGGFELEQVLSDTYPVLQAIDGDELATVLSELAASGDGLGDEIANSITNGATLAEVQASNDAELRQFLGDLALVTESLDADAAEILRGADNLNAALPSLNARSDDLGATLTQLERLSGDLATLLESNESFTTNALTNGTRTLEVLFDNRGQVQPVLQGLEDYASTLATAIRVQAQDGSMMAAVKNLLSVNDILGGLGDAGLPIPAAQSAGVASAPVPTATPSTSVAPPESNVVEDLRTTTERLLSILGGGS